MKQYFWWIKIISAVKLLMIMQYVLRSMSSSSPKSDSSNLIRPEWGLGQVNNDGYGYNILNQRNVTFMLRPNKCAQNTKLVLMVSSGPANNIYRSRWRRAAAGQSDIKVVFVVADSRTMKQQHDLILEHNTHRDIIQSSVADGHRLLAYKILMGYVWTYNECGHVPYVAKTDDNVDINLTDLLKILNSRHDDDKHFIACSVPSRNIATGRLSRPHMRGNWSLTKEQLEPDKIPDFCSGFLYVTKPQVGAALAQAGLHMYGDSEDVVITEDYLIAGVLREKVSGVDVETLRSDRVTDYLWQNYLSHCPWLVTLRQTFFNDLVLSKKSSRHNVQYVGGITNWGVWRFFLCLHLESILEMVELRVTGVVPDFLWDVCAR